MRAFAVLLFMCQSAWAAWQDVCDHPGCQLVTALDIYDELGEVHVHFENADAIRFTADVGSFKHFDTDVTLEEGTHQEIVMWRTFEDGFEHLGVIVNWRNGWSGNLPMDTSQRLVFHACPDAENPCTVAELKQYPSDDGMDDDYEELTRRELEVDDADSLFSVLKSKRRRLQDLRGLVPISLTVIYADNIGSNKHRAEDQATQVAIWTNAAMEASHIPAQFFVNAVASGSGFDCPGQSVVSCLNHCKTVYQSLPKDKQSDMYMCIVENFTLLRQGLRFTAGRATFNARHFVVRDDFMDSQTPTHEIGHMMGALHDDECNTEEFIIDGVIVSHWVGYKGTCGKLYANGKKKTIMARSFLNAPRQWIFSNTRIQDPSGDNPGDAGHDNAKFMNAVLSNKIDFEWDDGLKHFGLEAPMHSCGSSELGAIAMDATFLSAKECANYIMNNPDSCSSETFMWSPFRIWNRQAPCRCCTDNPAGWQPREDWSVYQINPWKEISNAIPAYWSCRISSTPYNSLNEAKFACRQDEKCGAVFYAASGWSLKSGFYHGGKHYLMKLTTGCDFPPATGSYGSANKFYVRNGHVSSNGAQAWIF